MSKVIIIHPQDKSTEFLKEIVKVLNETGKIVLIEPDSNFDAPTLMKQLDEAYAESDIILYLGHGRSDGLYGALNDRGEKSILLSKDQAREAFAKRNVVLFTCDSNELLRRMGQDVVRFVGFGDMPTDWGEIHAARDIGDYDYLSKLTDESLDKFRMTLVSMIISTRACLFEARNFSRAMYLMMRMELNKAMLRIAADKRSKIEERVELFKIIQNVKSDIIYKD